MLRCLTRLDIGMNEDPLLYPNCVALVNASRVFRSAFSCKGVNDVALPALTTVGDVDVEKVESSGLTPPPGRPRSPCLGLGPAGR